MKKSFYQSYLIFTNLPRHCWIDVYGVLVGPTTYDNIYNIVNDMCSFSVEYVYEDIENPDGSTTAKCIKNIIVTKKTCYEMAAEYGFSDEEIEWLNRIKGMS